jgi:hypothetical protein
MSGTTGHRCERSGMYQATCCKEQIALSLNETFPPCGKCRKATTWVLIRATQN